MAEYELEHEGNGVDDGQIYGESYNDYGASEEQADLMDLDSVAVSQEDAWAVIS